ncbi:MAG: tRNA (adenosine(37)-N6)-dimethylallyltransferase MiaA [Acidimicrobiales bacterium]
MSCSTNSADLAGCGPSPDAGGAGPMSILAAPSVVIVGCTATGKSALALALARRAGNVELLSADSMQVYRGMDIGTAKPSAVERAEAPHHLIDLVGIEDSFSVSDFQRAAAAASAEVFARGNRSVVVGGTGLYLQAVVDGLVLPGQFPEVRAELEAEADIGALHRQLHMLDPLAASRMEPSNRRRIVRALEVTVGSGRPFSSFGPGLTAYPPIEHRLIGLRMERARLSARIEARIRAQLDAGWLEEIRSLDANSGGRWSATAAQALGYRELRVHLAGQCTLAEAVDRTVIRTRQFARRQERWFRRDPRIRWLDAELVAANPMAVAATLLEDWPQP